MSGHLVAGERLKHRLAQSAETAGCSIYVRDEAHKPWHSALFMGGLHAVTFAIEGADAQWWIDGLDEHAIHLPGFVLAKLEVSTTEAINDHLTATIEAETVKEA